MSELLSNIRRQPALLAGIAAYLKGAGALELMRAAELLRQRRHVGFAGMGGSRYAAMPAAMYLAQSGIDASVLDASELLYYLPAPPECAVVLVSRSGRTAEAVKLAALLDEKAVPYIAVTNCPDSLMAQRAQATLTVACDPDYGVSVQTFTGAILTLLYLAAAAADRLDDLRCETNDMLTQLKGALPEWESSVPDLSGSRHVHLLGRGYSLSTACAGSLLFQEVARRPAAWHNAAEFRQGPVESLRPGDAVFVFAPDGPTREMNCSLARDLQSTGAVVHEIGPAWPGLPEHLAAVTQIIPIQFAAYALAVQAGVVPGEFRFAAETTEFEEGLTSTR